MRGNRPRTCQLSARKCVARLVVQGTLVRQYPTRMRRSSNRAAADVWRLVRISSTTALRLSPSPPCLSSTERWARRSVPAPRASSSRSFVTTMVCGCLPELVFTSIAPPGSWKSCGVPVGPVQARTASVGGQDGEYLGTEDVQLTEESTAGLGRQARSADRLKQVPPVFEPFDERDDGSDGGRFRSDGSGDVRGQRCEDLAQFIRVQGQMQLATLDETQLPIRGSEVGGTRIASAAPQIGPEDQHVAASRDAGPSGAGRDGTRG